MTRGPIVAAILEKENAVEDFRTLIGATNPADAAEGTIRKNMLLQLEKMLFTDLILMKMQLSKVLSTLLEESNFNYYKKKEERIIFP